MIVFIIIAAAIIVVELFIKKKAEDSLDEEMCFELDPVPIKVRKLHNYGMANSVLKDKPELVKIIGVVIMSVFVLLFILILPIKGRNGLKVAMALIIGGGLSNLLDRFLKGYVTDYFSFKTPFKRLNRLVFNLSDIFIFAGGVIAILAECLRKIRVLHRVNTEKNIHRCFNLMHGNLILNKQKRLYNKCWGVYKKWDSSLTLRMTPNLNSCMSF